LPYSFGKEELVPMAKARFLELSTNSLHTEYSCFQVQSSKLKTNATEQQTKTTHVTNTPTCSHQSEEQPTKTTPMIGALTCYFTLQNWKIYIVFFGLELYQFIFGMEKFCNISHGDDTI
jgi:hypothetical protein